MHKSTLRTKDPMMVAPEHEFPEHEFNQQEWNRQQYKGALLMMISMVACGILLASPSYLSARFAGVVMSFGPAMYMTGYLYLRPNSLRNRRGSLFTAVCLVAFLWLIAVGATVASLLDI